MSAVREPGCKDCLKTTAGDCGQHGPIQTRVQTHDLNNACKIPGCTNPETHMTSEHGRGQVVGDLEERAHDLWEQKFHELQFKHILLQERLIQMLLAREDLAQGCPCLHTEPCSPACSCASPVMSGGCFRCCSYGDEERKKRRAEVLAKLISGAP